GRTPGPAMTPLVAIIFHQAKSAVNCSGRPGAVEPRLTTRGRNSSNWDQCCKRLLMPARPAAAARTVLRAGPLPRMRRPRECLSDAMARAAQKPVVDARSARRARLLMAVAALLFALFCLNVLLGKARVAFGLELPFLLRDV